MSTRSTAYAPVLTASAVERAEGVDLKACAEARRDLATSSLATLDTAFALCDPELLHQVAKDLGLDLAAQTPPVALSTLPLARVLDAIIAASVPDPGVESQVVSTELAKLLHTSAVPLATSAAWGPWERSVREYLYRLQAIARRSNTTADTGLLGIALTQPSAVERSLVVSPLLAMATARTSTDPVFSEGCKAAEAQGVTTFAAWVACLDVVKRKPLAGQLPDLLNFLTIQRTYPAPTTLASTSPLAVHASPPSPVHVGALASPSPDDVWAGFPAPPRGPPLSHVLVDQGCGVGFVTPTPEVFDAMQGPSDLPLTGFDGSVQTSTRAGTIGRHLTGVLCPSASGHIWNPRQLCVTCGLTEATEDSGRWWTLRGADGAILLRAPIRKGGLVYLAIADFLQLRFRTCRQLFRCLNLFGACQAGQKFSSCTFSSK